MREAKTVHSRLKIGRLRNRTHGQGNGHVPITREESGPADGSLKREPRRGRRGGR